MTGAAIGLAIAVVLTLMPLANHANASDDQEKPISSRDLKTLQIPGKVAGVLWTVRPERCTLQIVPACPMSCGSNQGPGRDLMQRPQGIERARSASQTTHLLSARSAG
jgi:hypothetical protein